MVTKASAAEAEASFKPEVNGIREVVIRTEKDVETYLREPLLVAQVPYDRIGQVDRQLNDLLSPELLAYLDVSKVIGNSKAM